MLRVTRTAVCGCFLSLLLLSLTAVDAKDNTASTAATTQTFPFLFWWPWSFGLPAAQQQQQQQQQLPAAAAVTAGGGGGGVKSGGSSSSSSSSSSSPATPTSSASLPKKLGPPAPAAAAVAAAVAAAKPPTTTPPTTSTTSSSTDADAEEPEYDESQALPPIILRPNRDATEQLKLGCILPLGPGSAPEDKSVAEAVLLGMKMAITDELPQELPKYYVNLTCYNTQCSGLAAAAGVKYLYDQGVAGIIGDVCSTSSLAAAAAAKLKRIPVISPAATSPSLSMKDFFYRTVPSDIFQAFAASNLMYKDFGADRVGIIFESNSYGLGLADNLAAEDATTAQLVYEFRPGKGNATAAVAAAMAAKKSVTHPIDALFLAMNDIAFAAEFLLEADKQKLDMPLYGGDTLTSPELFELLKKTPSALANLSLISVNPGDANFVEAFKKAAAANGGIKFEPYAAPAYDATMAMLKAIEGSGPSMNHIRINEELESVVFDGATGPIQFDMFGDVVSHAESYVYGKFNLKTGKLELIGFIS